MNKIIISIIMLAIPTFSYANCWIVSGLQGKSSFNDDNYKFIDDGMTGVAIKLSINGNVASVTNLDGSSISDVTYIPLSSNTIIGSYQAGDGITVETWSITDDKKVMYSKVMNIPKMQKLTSTKAFVGNVAGSCDN